ncbi:MAG: S9 family peptidase [Bdellovibrionota bacterium]
MSFASDNSPSAQKAPIAKKENQILKKHGDKRVDPYFWMNKRDSKDVLDYLNAENKYYDTQMKPFDSLKTDLYNEIRGRMKDDEASVPYKKGSYYYFTRFNKGAEYPLFARKPIGSESEEILLDIPALAKDEKFFQVGAMSLSPDHNILAYAVDTVGRRFYDIHFRDLKNKKFIDYKILATTGSFAWANDNKTFFFAKQDPKTLRADKIYRGQLGSDKFELVFEEKDEAFHVGLTKSLTLDTILINSSSTLATEVQILDANEPQKAPRVFLKREKKHEYSVTDAGDRYYVISNWKAKNFQVFEVLKEKESQKSPSAFDKKSWKVLIPHSTKIFVEDIYAFEKYFILGQRQNALTELVVYKRTDKKSAMKKTPIRFKDEAYVAAFGANAEYKTEVFRYEYESLSQPPTTYDYDLKTNKSIIVHTKDVPNYNAADYKTLRLFATARDGAKIPISILVKKDFKPKAKNPLFVYGYGSYGYSLDPSFDRTVISLVDRDYAYAILHIRGGSEKGREWYESGKLMKKKNTFNDFIDATEFLVKKGYGQKNRVYAMGGSAGGLLMGTVLNMRPDLYNGVVAIVPFVDVVTTMLDDTIPLTTFEYDEWGNPNEAKYYKYMKSYSPYDNVKAKAYPNIFVATGYHDSQVQYWEPAKWVAKLRELNTSDKKIVFKTDMDAGHSGATGRFKSIEEDAMYYSFFLAVDNLINKK